MSIPIPSQPRRLTSQDRSSRRGATHERQTYQTWQPAACDVNTRGKAKEDIFFFGGCKYWRTSTLRGEKSQL
jgi:hypothetical protein